MKYRVMFLDEALTTLEKMSPDVANRIVKKIDYMSHDLAGDVKRLKAHFPNDRLRVGD